MRCTDSSWTKTPEVHGEKKHKCAVDVPAELLRRAI
jgi:hypothetical protein